MCETWLFERNLKGWTDSKHLHDTNFCSNFWRVGIITNLWNIVATMKKCTESHKRLKVYYVVACCVSYAKSRVSTYTMHFCGVPLLLLSAVLSFKSLYLSKYWLKNKNNLCIYI